MLKRLQNKWQVTPWRLLIILVIFGVGGSLCGWLGRQILVALDYPRNWTWYIVYIILVTILWPLCVLAVSIPLGQFNFFRNYLANMGRRMGLARKQKISKVAIFASGAGSNARKIIDHFRNNKQVEVALVVCNRPGAGVIAIAKQNNIPLLMVEQSKFFEGDHYLEEIKQHHIDWIVLAGFLWKVPNKMIAAFPNRIINIHPALLPKYGGKGMYGHHVHEAVIKAGEKHSGITVHFVDEIYDHGDHIFQAVTDVLPTDTARSLAVKIHTLEHEHFPRIIEQTIAKGSLNS